MSRMLCAGIVVAATLLLVDAKPATADHYCYPSRSYSYYGYGSPYSSGYYYRPRTRVHYGYGGYGYGNPYYGRGYGGHYGRGYYGGSGVHLRSPRFGFGVRF